jgi:hypothetical protein
MGLLVFADGLVDSTEQIFNLSLLVDVHFISYFKQEKVCIHHLQINSSLPNASLQVFSSLRFLAAIVKINN